MREWDEIQEYIKAHNPDEIAWYRGFLDALLYAQAALDHEGGQQTLKLHLPDERLTETDEGVWDWKPFDPIMLECIAEDLDDAGILWTHYTLETSGTTTKYYTPYLEVGGSEGYHGHPDRDCNGMKGAEELYEKFYKQKQEARTTDPGASDSSPGKED